MTESHFTPRLEAVDGEVLELPPIDVTVEITIVKEMAEDAAILHEPTNENKRTQSAPLDRKVPDHPVHLVELLVGIAKDAWKEAEVGGTPVDMTIRIYKKGVKKSSNERPLARLRVKNSENINETNAMIRFNWEHFSSLTQFNL